MDAAPNENNLIDFAKMSTKRERFLFQKSSKGCMNQI